MTKHKWDWKSIDGKLKQLDTSFTSIAQLAKHLNIPRRTVHEAVKRGDISPNIEKLNDPSEFDGNSFSFQQQGNEAWLKYESADPLSPMEAAEIGGVDLDEWEIEKQRINLWQMGRKDKKVSLQWIEGKADGYVEDTGKIHKTYLYQVEVKLTRKRRIAVLPVIHPIEMNNDIIMKESEIDYTSGTTRILFVTDPHFGFRVDPFSTPEPFHSRPFLNDLLAISIGVQIDVTVWGGDILDLADFSRFPSEPAIIQKTQIAGIEAAWVLNQFGKQTKKQVIIEGNHDIRLPKAMAQNFKAAYELRPVHDLGGEPMMSIPRFLGFDQSDIEWVGDYPNGFHQIGDIRFSHGSVARKGSGSTVQSMLKDLMVTTFFGHIHRHETASKHVDGSDELITAGCPGCACRKEFTPGATRFSNWSIGAFLISLDKGKLKQVEEIRHKDGSTYFRGQVYRGSDYLDHMKDEIPDKYVDSL